MPEWHTAAPSQRTFLGTRALDGRSGWGVAVRPSASPCGRGGVPMLVGESRRGLLLGRWGATARQHHDAVAASDLGIDPFQNQHFAIEAYHLAIFDTEI